MKTGLPAAFLNYLNKKKRSRQHNRLSLNNFISHFSEIIKTTVMKKFKIIDTWISIGLIVAGIIISLAKMDYSFLIAYCVVGGWQMISMLVHAIKGWFTHLKTARYNYHALVTTITAISLLGLWLIPVLYVLMAILLFAAPFMAIYYTWLCYEEVYVKMQRPLAALK